MVSCWWTIDCRGYGVDCGEALHVYYVGINVDEVLCPITYNGLSTYIIYSTGTIMYVV